VSVFFCGLCVGVIIGLIFGPDSEREHAAKVDGWISGYRFARPKQTPNLHRETPNMTERSEDALKAKCYTTRQVTHEEARQIAKRFIDANFNNPGERPRIGIPARPDYDDDLLLCAYIEQQAALPAEREKLREALSLMPDEIEIFRIMQAEGGHHAQMAKAIGRRIEEIRTALRGDREQGEG
jgi:Sec-independent protein translocase protein TatA